MHLYVPDICFECSTNFLSDNFTGQISYRGVAHTKLVYELPFYSPASFNDSTLPLAGSLGAGFVKSLVLGNVCRILKLSYRCLNVCVSVICRGPQQVLWVSWKPLHSFRTFLHRFKRCDKQIFVFEILPVQQLI